MSSSRCALPVLVAVLMGVGLFAPAQAVSLTGSLEITVEARSGDRTESLPGATVTITNPKDATLRWSGTTDPSGKLVFGQVIARSDYDVVVRMPGYSPAQQHGVRVVAGVTTRLAIRVLAELAEQVLVKGKAQLIDLNTETQGSTTLSGDMFQDLPVLGRDYQAVLSLAPGVQDVDGDGNPNVHGSRDVDFRLTVDGVSNVDPLTGKFQSYINPDAIEELIVIDAGADASYGGAVGGYGQVLLKSGTNRLDGAVNLFVQNGSLNKKVDPNSNAAFTLTQPSIFLSGPIARDRIWFALSHEHIVSTTPTVGYNGLHEVDLEAWRHNDKLTWQIDPKNRLQLSWRSDPRTMTPLGIDALSRPETGYTQREGGPTATLKWTAPFTPTFSLETTLAHSDIKFEQTPVAPGAHTTCVTTDPDNMYSFLSGYTCTNDTMGGVREGPYNIENHETRARNSYAIGAEKFVASPRWGEHRLKFGAELSQTRFDRELTVSPQVKLSVTPVNGFSTEGPRNGQPYLLDTIGYYFPDRGNDDFLDPTHPFLLRPQTGLDTSRGNYYAFYATDTWQPRTDITFTFGLRFSREELSSQGYNPLAPAAERAAYSQKMSTCAAGCATACDPYNSTESRCTLCLRVCAAQTMGANFTIYPLDNPLLVSGGGDSLNCEFALNRSVCGRLESYLQGTGKIPAIRRSESFGIVNNALAPRAAISWDPTNDGKTRVYTSWGRYYGDTPLQPLVMENGPDEILSQFPLNADRAPVDYSGAPVPMTNYDSSASIHTVNRNLKMQHSDEWVLGVEREIAPETAIAVRYVRREYADQLQDRDINHQPISDADMLNRPYNVGPRSRVCPKVDGYWDCTGLVLYAPVGSPNSEPSVASYPDGLPDLQVINPFFNNIYEIGNYNRTLYRALILEIKRRWFQNWELLASYTRSRAEGDAEEFASELGNDVTAADHERGVLSYDQTHVVKGTARVHVPWLGGMVAGTRLTWQSGLPYSLYEDREVFDFATDLDVGYSRAYQLAARRAGRPWSIDGTSTYYSTLRRIYPTGTRNDMRNPAYWNLDLNLQKDFTLGRVQATLQVDVFNALNDNSMSITAVRQDVIGTDDSGNLVYVRTPLYGVPRARRYQFGLKLKF